MPFAAPETSTTFPVNLIDASDRETVRGRSSVALAQGLHEPVDDLQISPAQLGGARFEARRRTSALERAIELLLTAQFPGAARQMREPLDDPSDIAVVTAEVVARVDEPAPEIAGHVGVELEIQIRRSVDGHLAAHPRSVVGPRVEAPPVFPDELPGDGVVRDPLTLVDER